MNPDPFPVELVYRLEEDAEIGPVIPPALTNGNERIFGLLADEEVDLMICHHFVSNGIAAISSENRMKLLRGKRNLGRSLCSALLVKSV